jgi:hypothetical protein
LQQRSIQQFVGSLIDYCASRSLLPVLRHGHCFAHVFGRSLTREQGENEINNLCGFCAKHDFYLIRT